MNKTIKAIIIVLLSLTPFFNIYELLTYLSIPIISESQMIFFKAPKDLLFILLLLFSGIKLFKRKINLVKFIGLFLYFSITALSIIISYFYVDSLIILAGIRWSLSFCLLFFLIDIIDELFLTKLSVLLGVLIVLNLTMQILELIYMPPFFGFNYFGGSGRLPGFMVHPSGCGMFGGISLFFIKFYGANIRFRSIILQLVCIISIILSQSTLGFILMAVVYGLPKIYTNKYKFIYLLILFPVALFIFFNIDFITGRGEGNSSESIGTRIDIFSDMVNNSEVLSSNFGNATNIGQNTKDILNKANNSFIADSLYTSIFVNYGVIAFLIFMFFFLVGAIKLYYKKNIPYFLFFLIFGLSSISIITSELFPVNLLYPVVFSFYLKTNIVKHEFN